MMRETAKHYLGHGLFAAGLDSMLLRNTGLVVMFHRVQQTDGFDPLTVDVNAFERYCRFFRRHFRVITLGDLVRTIESGAPLDRALTITFDDGYLDNYNTAAPVLEKLGLPATFFVVTQWIGTAAVPWWDEQRGVRHPWMTWSDVRSLHRKGFEIGAHTRTHVDLGQVGYEDALKEILGARLEIERQIHDSASVFAYPYGGRENLSETSRALVKAAGFKCCCSAFGGINGPGTDPFHLRRIPVSAAYTSPHQFGFDVALGRSILPDKVIRLTTPS